MTKPLWIPSSQRIDNSELKRFEHFLLNEYQVSFSNYDKLHQWTIDNRQYFWEAIWKFSHIIYSQPYTSITTNSDQFPTYSSEPIEWFKGARFNFAENLLRYRDDKTALISLLENGKKRTITYQELYRQVEQLSAALKNEGVAVGDRVAGFMPNIIETVVAMLATTSIGATWSSCSPDFGINGVLDRFGQIEPTILFAADGYYYNGKSCHSLKRIEKIISGIKSIKKVIITPVINKKPDISTINHSVIFNDFLIANDTPALNFEQLPFNHPLYVMYSSGTTGIPKCIVHGAGGTLLQHIKEHKLHTDLKRDDTFFFYTTCGWMMWNWLVSALTIGCKIVLYDGSPFAESDNGNKFLLETIDREKISVFGTSAKFISALEKANIKPKENHKLSTLKTLLSTGSPLAHENFDYVYRDIKQDICLSSISGGTDIISCFALGNTTLPVHRGELQSLGLGMAVEIWDESQQTIKNGKGELVCTKPFPSCPIYFWNDPDNEQFHHAYFDKYKNVWVHGDYGELTKHNGIVIHGRSDALLNPGGVRIGTAEIYRQVEKIKAIIDSIVVGQEWDNDIRIILFVVLKDKTTLTEQLVNEIKTIILQNTTPRHVPAKIIAVADIPRTISGKIVELAVKNVIHNKPVKNADALANPQALSLYKNLPELKT